MASMSGLTAEQLAQLLDGPNPMPMPAYTLPSIYDGVLPSLPAISSYGPPQGTKRDRASLPDASNSLSEPWGGTYDQTAYRNGQTRRDIIQNIPAPNVQTASNYSTLDTVTPLDINRLGLTTSPFRKTPAEQAIAEITVRGGGIQPSGGRGRGRPTRPLPSSPLVPLGPPSLTGDDPWAGLRVAPAGGGRTGLATGTPGGVVQPPQERSGGLLGLLLGGFGGGEGINLGSLLAGGGRATGDQLASMQAAASLAQDPALAAALASGAKGYVPTNPDATGVLGSGALMPTVAMNGNPIRNR